MSITMYHITITMDHTMNIAMALTVMDPMAGVGSDQHVNIAVTIVSNSDRDYDKANFIVNYEAFIYCTLIF